MRCCKRKRSANDSLLDSQTNTRYCATCWQTWLSSQPQPATKTPPQPSSPPPDPTLFIDDDSVGHLRGATHNDILYLISNSLNLVFSPQRTSDGHLRIVGELKHGQIHLHTPESALTTDFPFAVDPDDHCETPFQAYADLAPYLHFLASCLGKTATTLRIWDPYYCNGAVVRHFARLGFTSVRNECRDFYAIVESQHFPDYDVIVTNPPYSTHPFDHVQRLVKILCAQRKPWFVVQPNYVYVKPFWEQYTAAMLAPRPFFLTPPTPRKYKYNTPEGMRQIKAQQLKTSPFISMWYCWVGPKYTEQLYRWVASRGNDTSLPLSLACCEFFLPDCFKDSNDKTRRKPRKGSKRKSEQSDQQLSSRSSQTGKKKKKKIK